MICCEMLALIRSTQWKLMLLIGTRQFCLCPRSSPPRSRSDCSRDHRWAAWSHLYHHGCRTCPRLAPIQGVDVGDVHGDLVSVTERDGLLFPSSPYQWHIYSCALDIPTLQEVSDTAIELRLHRKPSGQTTVQLPLLALIFFNHTIMFIHRNNLQ